MKSNITHIALFIVSILLFTGCYTKFNATQQQATIVEESWLEIDGAYFFINYNTRYWYNYHGIDLTTDQRFLRMAYLRYHHPTSTYFYSPFRNSMFYNYPGYADNFFFRANRGSGTFNGTCHPPYYSSNSYMENYNCNRLAHFYYWQTAFPSYWDPEVYKIVSANPPSPGLLPPSSRNMTNYVYGGLQARDGFVNRGLDADNSDLFLGSHRDRITATTVDRISINGNEEKSTIRDRRGDDYRNRLESNRSIRTLTPLSSWSSWEQGNINNSGNVNRSFGVGNRTSGTRSTGSSAVRGNSSSRTGDSSGTTRTSGSNRSSGESSTSRGNN